METSFDCVACLAKQAVKIAEDFNGEYSTKENILRSCLKILSESSYELSSPVVDFFLCSRIAH